MGCVLVIDEYEPFRQTMEFCLPRFGHTVLTARDARSAIALDAARVEVVLLDAGRRWLTGFAVCEQLKRHAVFARVPVVMMAATITAEVCERALAAGASEVVTKPFCWPDLLAVLARHLPRLDAAGRIKG